MISIKYKTIGLDLRGYENLENELNRIASEGYEVINVLKEEHGRVDLHRFWFICKVMTFKDDRNHNPLWWPLMN